MQLNVNEFVKESLKLKGSIDVKKTTAESLKELEKNGVNVSLLLAGILDSMDLKSMIKSLKSDDENHEKNSVDVGMNS